MICSMVLLFLLPDFETVMGRFMSKKSAYKMVYCVFDVIYIDGCSIANKPLIERKSMLSDLNLEHDNVFVIEGLQGNGLAYFNLAKEKHLEGIVVLRKLTPLMKSINVPIAG